MKMLKRLLLICLTLYCGTASAQWMGITSSIQRNTSTGEVRFSFGQLGVLPVARLVGGNTWSGFNNFQDMGARTVSLSAYGGTLTAGDISVGQYLRTSTLGADRPMGLRMMRNGLDRWQLLTNGTSEGGANVGSNFNILRYSDAGALIDTPLRISRMSGVVDLSNYLTINSNQPGQNAIYRNQSAEWYKGAGSAKIYHNNPGEAIYEATDGSTGGNHNFITGGTSALDIQSTVVKMKKQFSLDYLSNPSTERLLIASDDGTNRVFGRSSDFYAASTDFASIQSSPVKKYIFNGYKPQGDPAVTSGYGRTVKYGNDLIEVGLVNTSRQEFGPGITIAMRKALNGSKTFGPWVTIKNPSAGNMTFDNPTIGLVNNRLTVWFKECVIPGLSTSQTYNMYSDNAGSTWSAVSAISSAVVGTQIENSNTAILRGGDNKYYIPLFSSGGNYCELWQTTDGATWTYKSTVVDVRSVPLLNATLTEPHLAFAGNNTFVIQFRNNKNPGGHDVIYASTNNGTSWSLKGRASSLGRTGADSTVSLQTSGDIVIDTVRQIVHSAKMSRTIETSSPANDSLYYTISTVADYLSNPANATRVFTIGRPAGLIKTFSKGQISLFMPDLNTVMGETNESNTYLNNTVDNAGKYRTGRPNTFIVQFSESYMETKIQRPFDGVYKTPNAVTGMNDYISREVSNVAVRTDDGQNYIADGALNFGSRLNSAFSTSAGNIMAGKDRNGTIIFQLRNDRSLRAYTTTLVLGRNPAIPMDTVSTNGLITPAGWIQARSPNTNDRYLYRDTTSGKWYQDVNVPTGSGGIVRASSPALTGTPTAPTAALGTNTTQVANMAAVQQELTGYIKPLRLTGSGTGAATTISIPHGLTGVTSTSTAVVTPASAPATGNFYVTTDATNLNIIYTVAPVAGTNNLIYNITLKL